MLTFKEDIKDTQIYLGLRKKVGWIELNPVQAQRALDNSMKIIIVYDDDKPIGMGRIVGDGAGYLLYTGFDYYTWHIRESI